MLSTDDNKYAFFFFAQGLKGDAGSPGVAGPKGEKVLFYP